MNKDLKLQKQKEVEAYLQDKHMYEIFESLMNDLIVEQPTDPLKFLIDQLEAPEHKKIFIVGPPGSKVLPLALALCDYFHFTCVSVRDLLNKQVSSKSEVGQEIEAQMKRFGLVEDKLVNDIVWAHLKKLEKEEKVVVVAGYPMTKNQAIQVEIKSGSDDKLVVINLGEEKIIEACLEKLQKSENENDGRYKEIEKSFHKELSTAYTLQYQMQELNIGEIKRMFKNNCYQLDGEQSIVELIEELAKILKYKINSKSPKHATQIIICGASGRSQLARQICEKYGLTYISVSHLLKSTALKNNEEFSQKILEDIKNGELVSDSVILPLLQERLAQKDCQMQGFVLDGFPKNANQLQQFDQLNLNPNFILIFETDDNLSFDKKSEHNSGIQKELDPLEDGDANSRIINLSNETEDVQKKRWKETLKDIEKTYSESKIIFKVSSRLSNTNVIEKIFYHLENSV